MAIVICTYNAPVVAAEANVVSQASKDSAMKYINNVAVDEKKNTDMYAELNSKTKQEMLDVQAGMMEAGKISRTDRAAAALAKLKGEKLTALAGEISGNPQYKDQISTGLPGEKLTPLAGEISGNPQYKDQIA